MIYTHASRGDFLLDNDTTMSARFSFSTISTPTVKNVLLSLLTLSVKLAALLFLQALSTVLATALLLVISYIHHAPQIRPLSGLVIPQKRSILAL